VDGILADAIWTHHADLSRRAYDQARQDVELRYPAITDEVLAEIQAHVVQQEQERIQATMAEAINLVKSDFDVWRHSELRTRQDDALARLAQWEQDCHEEQICDFQCAWDSIPLHALKPTLDTWLASRGLHIVALAVDAPFDPIPSSLAQADLPDVAAPCPVRRPILDLTPASTQYTVTHKTVAMFCCFSLCLKQHMCM